MKAACNFAMIWTAVCIKPVKENARTISDMTSNSCVIVCRQLQHITLACGFNPCCFTDMTCSDQSCSKQKSGNHSVGASRISVPEEVHSYEVRARARACVQLILEYCDRASLRDALDAAFSLFWPPNKKKELGQMKDRWDLSRVHTGAVSSGKKC
eukprot:1145725-Pelagomonas_calceolata.AAC.1